VRSVVKKISITEFKRMTAQEIKESPCVEVVADGEPLFIAIVGAESDMRIAMISQASMIDASRGKGG